MRIVGKWTVASGIAIGLCGVIGLMLEVTSKVRSATIAL